MKKTRILFGVAALCLLARIGLAQQPAYLPEVDKLVQDAYNRGLFSGTVILAKDGEPFYQKTLGYSDWEKKTPISSQTHFNIGSINKAFTREIMEQLMKEGKVKPEDQLVKYLPGFKDPQAEKITIQHLLEMKSGMGDYFAIPAFGPMRGKNVSIGEVVEIIKQEPLKEEPGTRQIYSNSGFVVLGGVIEKVTGASFEENLKTRILQPLGLNQTHYAYEAVNQLHDRGIPTRLQFDGSKTPVYTFTSATPAGGMYATASDLLRFISALSTGKLPSGHVLRGVVAGGTESSNAVAGKFKDSDVTVVIVANMGQIADELAPRIAAITQGKPYKEVPVPAQITLYQTLKNKGIGEVKNNLKEIVQQSGNPFDVRFLNYHGYQFLQANETDMAIDLFKLNTELFPEAPNAFDSLAEGYMAKGDKAMAKKYYQKVLEMQPENKNAQKKLEELKGS